MTQKGLVLSLTNKEIALLRKAVGAHINALDKQVDHNSEDAALLREVKRFECLEEVLAKISKRK